MNKTIENILNYTKKTALAATIALTLQNVAEAKPLTYLTNLAQRVKTNPDFRTADTYTREFWVSRGERIFVTYRDNGDNVIGSGDRLTMVKIKRKNRKNYATTILDDQDLDGFSVKTPGDYAVGIPQELVDQFGSKVKTPEVLADMHQLSLAKILIRKCKYLDRRKR